MEHGDISNQTMPTLAFSVNALIEPEAKEGSKWWVERIPGDWLEGMGQGVRGLLARATVTFKPRTEAFPIITAMQDKHLYRVACYDVVPRHLQGLVRDALKRHFPTVDVILAETVPDLKALLLTSNIDAYYTGNQNVFGHVRFLVKTHYFTDWREI